MSLRVDGQALHDKVNEVAKGFLFLRPVVRPKIFKHPLALLAQVHAKQVLQPAFVQRVAFHVKKEVALVGRGQAVKAREARSVGLQRLVNALPGLALTQLQPRLVAQALEGFG